MLGVPPSNDAVLLRPTASRSEPTPSHHQAHLMDGPPPGHAEGQRAGELDEADDLAHQRVLHEHPTGHIRIRRGTTIPADGCASGLSGAPRITQGGKPPRVAGINPVMHQEASQEGVHPFSPRETPGKRLSGGCVPSRTIAPWASSSWEMCRPSRRA
jgi:hypothetical protein